MQKPRRQILCLMDFHGSLKGSRGLGKFRLAGFSGSLGFRGGGFGVYGF